MTHRFLVVNLALFLCFVLPQSVLHLFGMYAGKLRVDVNYDSNFFVGLVCMLLFMLIFFSAAAMARIDLATIKRQSIRLDEQDTFRFICVGITLVCFALLTVGIGVKQSESGSNFIIRFIPREIVLISTVCLAAVTRRPFWILLLALNIVYWILVGSKAALFIAILGFVYFHTLERLPIKRSHVVLVSIGVVVLPISFLIPIAYRVGLAPEEILRLFFESPEFFQQTVGRMAGRVSWFDGLFLTASDVAPLSQFGVGSFLEVAIAKLLPGVASSIEPFGQQVIYLFRGVNLDDFAGAVGMPGVLKMLLYNRGVGELIVMLGIIWVAFYLCFRLMRSDEPMKAVVGLTCTIVAITNLAVSGNIDSALAKLIPLAISGFFIFFATRALLLINK